jgi:hypothetical protein
MQSIIESISGGMQSSPDSVRKSISGGMQSKLSGMQFINEFISGGMQSSAEYTRKSISSGMQSKSKLAVCFRGKQVKVQRVLQIQLEFLVDEKRFHPRIEDQVEAAKAAEEN